MQLFYTLKSTRSQNPLAAPLQNQTASSVFWKTFVTPLKWSQSNGLYSTVDACPTIITFEFGDIHRHSVPKDLVTIKEPF